MNAKRLKKIISISVPIVFYGLFAIFLVIYVRSLDYSQLKALQISWPYILIATIVGLGFRYWGVYIWVVLLKSLGATQLGNTSQLVYVYAKSWLGRYIPTPAAWMMGKVYFASKHGISKNKLAVSSILEGALQVIVVMTISFVMLTFDARFDVVEPRYRLLMFTIIIVGIVAMMPPLFNRAISLVYSIAKRKPFDKSHQATGAAITKGAFLYIIGAILNGLSLFFIAKAVHPSLGYDSIIFVMGVGNLAGAASMLAIFAPSGIGVREGIQLVLLSIIMPKEAALVITVMTRLWGVGVDFLFFGLSKLQVRSKRA